MKDIYSENGTIQLASVFSIGGALVPNSAQETDPKIQKKKKKKDQETNQTQKRELGFDRKRVPVGVRSVEKDD